MNEIQKCRTCGLDLILPEEMDRGECLGCRDNRSQNYVSYPEYPIIQQVMYIDIESILKDMRRRQQEADE